MYFSVKTPLLCTSMQQKNFSIIKCLFLTILLIPKDIHQTKNARCSARHHQYTPVFQWNKMNAPKGYYESLNSIMSVCFIPFSRHQDPTFDHECHMWLRPHQGDKLHGACTDLRLPTYPIQCRLGCQVNLDPPLLHAFLCCWYWPEAGAATTFKECVANVSVFSLFQ